MHLSLAPRRTLAVGVLLALVVLSAVASRGAAGDDAADGPAKPAKPDDAPALVEATRGAFAVVLELEGTLDASDAVRVEVDAKAYDGELEATGSPVLAPTRVEKDRVLAEFDPERLDEQLAVAGREIAVARASLARAEEEERRERSASERALERARVERERATESLAYFDAVARAKRVAESELDLGGVRDQLADQEEELEQLTKMYRADDVVEETEKIVMARTRRGMDRLRRRLAFHEESHERLVRVELPREHEDLVRAAERAGADLERLVALAPIELEKGRRELARSTLELERQARTLARLTADRERLVVRAPVAGTAFPGSLDDGRWSGSDEVARALARKDGLRPHRVLYTIVPGPARVVRTRVEEASLRDVEPGRAAEIRVPALAGRVLHATVASVSPQVADGKALVLLELAADEVGDGLVPGLSARVRLALPTRPDAITVPEASVTSKGDRRRVHVVVDGKATARDVEVGATMDGRTEILSGLEAGTKVLESPPK